MLLLVKNSKLAALQRKFSTQESWLTPHFASQSLPPALPVAFLMKVLTGKGQGWELTLRVSTGPDDASGKGCGLFLG